MTDRLPIVLISGYLEELAAADTLSVAKLKVTTGPAVGQVLTSDASGNATWQTAPGGFSAAPVEVTQSADQVINSTTPTDLPGLTTTITSAGPSAVYMAIGQVRGVFGLNSTEANRFVLACVADGTELPLVATENCGQSFGGIIRRDWLVTGLAAGSRVIKLRAYNNASTTSHTVRADESSLIVYRLA